MAEMDAYKEDPFWTAMNRIAGEHPTERARLEQDVIRCAKLFRRIKAGKLDATWSDRTALADNDLDAAVDALIAFESTQVQGEEK